MREKELCKKAHHLADQRQAGTDTTPELFLFFTGTGTVHELVCQPLDETEGAQPRIRLTGIIYRVEWASRTQAWNVSEWKCIIDQKPAQKSSLIFAKCRDGGWKKTIAFTKGSMCAIVSLPALLPTQSPLHLHRLLDCTEQKPILASFSFSTPASK